MVVSSSTNTDDDDGADPMEIGTHGVGPFRRRRYDMKDLLFHNFPKVNGLMYPLPTTNT